MCEECIPRSEQIQFKRWINKSCIENIVNCMNIFARVEARVDIWFAKKSTFMIWGIARFKKKSSNVSKIYIPRFEQIQEMN